MFVKKSTYEQLYALHTKLVADHAALTAKHQRLERNHQELLTQIHGLQKPVANTATKTTLKASNTSKKPSSKKIKGA